MGTERRAIGSKPASALKGVAVETTWLEDFVVLAETRSFSRAAQHRHVTQPAFSRRIQALEAWVGMELLDRTTYPPSMTPAGEHFYTQAQDLLNRIGYLRLSSNEIPGQKQEVIGFAIPHTLSLSFFPTWLTQAQEAIGSIECQLRVDNVLDVVLWLVEGGCDILICYHHPQQPVQLDPERYDMLILGTESLAAYSALGENGRPKFEWPGKPQQPVPFLAYTSKAYLSRMTDIALNQDKTTPHLRRVFNTDMAEGLRRMALAGHGVAFLPASIAAEDIQRGSLCKLSGGWELNMQIRAYRERPTLNRPARNQVSQLWKWMELQSLPSFPGSLDTNVSPPNLREAKPNGRRFTAVPAARRAKNSSTRDC